MLHAFFVHNCVSVKPKVWRHLIGTHLMFSWIVLRRQLFSSHFFIQLIVILIQTEYPISHIEQAFFHVLFFGEVKHETNPKPSSNCLYYAYVGVCVRVWLAAKERERDCSCLSDCFSPTHCPFIGSGRLRAYLQWRLISSSDIRIFSLQNRWQWSCLLSLSLPCFWPWLVRLLYQ